MNKIINFNNVKRGQVMDAYTCIDKLDDKQELIIRETLFGTLMIRKLEQHTKLPIN